MLSNNIGYGVGVPGALTYAGNIGCFAVSQYQTGIAKIAESGDVYVPLLDENGVPILDENGVPIYVLSEEIYRYYKEQLGISRITIITSKTQAGVSRIQVGSSLKTQTGISTIAPEGYVYVPLLDENGVPILDENGVPIYAWVPGYIRYKLQLGISRISIEAVSRVQTGISRIGFITSRDQTGISRIVAIPYRIQLGISSIKNTIDRVQNGISRIGFVTSVTQVGSAYIVMTPTVRIQRGVAQIIASLFGIQTQTGTSSISSETFRIQRGKARIWRESGPYAYVTFIRPRMTPPVGPSPPKGRPLRGPRTDSRATRIIR